MPSLAEKKQNLDRILSSLPNALIAYSGGVDSALLLWYANRVLGPKALGVLADSPSLKRSELTEALDFAQSWNLNLRILKTGELDNPDYASNPLNRCYYCKHELFQQMDRLARAEKYRAICYGENADDAGEFRPGRQAAAEFKILAPLREAGLAKTDVRALAREVGLSVSEKAAQPCLSSRIPSGQTVTEEKLRRIEEAEAVLQDEGFRIFRVRHQEQKAFVQVSPGETPRLLQEGMRKKISITLSALGFESVEFDLAGYQGASLR